MERIIKRCRGCGSDRIIPFFDLGEQPFANALLTENEVKCEKKYPLSLSYCEDCSLVQLDYTADPKELFSNYYWVTGTSSTAVKYAQTFFENVKTRKPEKESNFAIEVASNDGTFLKAFKNGGYRVLGIDPAENIASIATENGIPTKAVFFGAEAAKEVLNEEGCPDVLFARNVMPHVADVNDFVEGLSILSGRDTLTVIEVHYSGIIADELHYDSIYHEHLCYFTLKSVTNILQKHGLFLNDVMRSPISGGSIVLFASKEKKDVSDRLRTLEEEETKKNYNKLDCWREFAERAKLHRDILRKTLTYEKSDGNKIVAYGASARSSTMLNYCGIDYSIVDCVIDQNELKRGKLTPGTHIPIVSPEEGLSRNPDTILLLAWNFYDEIIKLLKDKYHFKGRVIVPLPFEVREEEI